MSGLPVTRAAFRARFLVVAASLALVLLSAAALASNELRSVLLAPGPTVPIDATPYLGLTYVPLSHELAARYGVDAGVGVLVTAVEEDGPAGVAGLRKGDILLSAASVPLTLASSVVGQLFEKRPGERVSFQALRDGKTLTVELVLGVWTQK